MRITHVNTHDEEGGAARVALRLAIGQRQAGHGACLLTGRKSLPGDISRRFDPMPDEALRDFCESARLPYLHFQGSHLLVGDEAVQAADVVHVHNIHFDYFNPFSLAFLSHAKPLIWTLHDLYPVTGFCLHPAGCPAWEKGCVPCDRRRLNDPPGIEQDLPPLRAGRLGPGVGFRLKRLVYEHCRVRFVCPSQWMQRQVERSMLKDKPVSVVYNGVDATVFTPRGKAQARRKLRLPVDAPVLGAVAVLGAFGNPLKGGLAIREAVDMVAARLPGVVLLNVGSDAPSPHPNIRNIPFVKDSNELADIYSALDVFLHASSAESFCLVAAEAMACGVPVAAFDAGPLPEVVSHGETGLLCPAGNVKAFGQAVLALLEDAELRQRFGRAGRERVQAVFAFGNTLKGYQDLYEQECGNRRNASMPPRAFDLAALPPLVKTPAFLRAEGLRTGKDLLSEAPSGDLAELTLAALAPGERDDMEKLHRKAGLIRQVFALRGEGRLEESLALLESLLADWPQDTALWRTKGVTLGLLGREREAIETFQRCLAAPQPQTDVWLNMADMYLRAGRLQECGLALDTFAGIDSKLRGYNHRRGLLLAALGRPREAVRAFLAELRLHGSHESVEPLRCAWKKR